VVEVLLAEGLTFSQSRAVPQIFRTRTSATKFTLHFAIQDLVTPKLFSNLPVATGSLETDDRLK